MPKISFVNILKAFVILVIAIPNATLLAQWTVAGINAAETYFTGVAAGIHAPPPPAPAPAPHPVAPAVAGQ